MFNRRTSISSRIDKHLYIRASRFLGLLCGFLLLNFTPAFAQGITVGGKIGGNFNTFRVEEGPSVFSASPGLQAGIMLNVASSPVFSLQTGLGITQLRGQKSTVNPADTLLNLESNVNLAYADVPVLLKFTTGYKYRFFANVGPSIGILLRGREKGSLLTTTENGAEVVDGERSIEAEYKDYNISLAVGGGLLIDNLIFEVRYQYGVTNLTRQNMKSGALLLTAGYLLYL